jgi:hypothetical protein
VTVGNNKSYVGYSGMSLQSKGDHSPGVQQPGLIPDTGGISLAERHVSGGR